MASRSLPDADTQTLFATGKCKRFANIANAATRKLTQLDNAPSVEFMGRPPGTDLKSFGNFWRVRIDDQWRLLFKWREAGPYDVKIDDRH